MKELTEQQLYIEYVNNNRTWDEIAGEYGKDRNVVIGLIRLYGFQEPKRKKWGMIRKK